MIKQNHLITYSVIDWLINIVNDSLLKEITYVNACICVNVYV